MSESPRKPPRQMSRLSRILSQQGLRTDKRFSQNFLVNQGALEGIVKASGVGPHSAVVEIGAGLGNLTELLAHAAGHVTAVELDRKFQPIHERYLASIPNLGFAYGDFLQMPLSGLFHGEELGEKIVVGNIPYSITAKILMKLLNEHEQFSRAYILMQREVADRLKANPGTKQYSVLTAKLKCVFEMRTVLRISPRSFLPAPKVESALVELTHSETPLEFTPEERGEFFAMLDGAFGQRRKTLPNSLSHATGGKWNREEVAKELQSMNLLPTARAEELQSSEFLSLYRNLRDKSGSPSFLMHRSENSAKLDR